MDTKNSVDEGESKEGMLLRQEEAEEEGQTVHKNERLHEEGKKNRRRV